MIRKLPSGEYRLYSRKKDAKRAAAERTWVHFGLDKRPRSTNEPSSISSAANDYKFGQGDVQLESGTLMLLRVDQ